MTVISHDHLNDAKIPDMGGKIDNLKLYIYFFLKLMYMESNKKQDIYEYLRLKKEMALKNAHNEYLEDMKNECFSNSWFMSEIVHEIYLNKTRVIENKYKNRMQKSMKKVNFSL